MTATAAGVVAGVTLLAAIIGISSTSSSILAKIAPSSPEEVSKSAPVVVPQRQSVKATSRAPLPRLQGNSRIAIKARQGSWIDACADGHTLLREYLPQAKAVDLGFSKVAVVRTGNAGGVEISVNGRSTGPLGEAGEVRVIQFDAKGFHFLELGAPGTECGE